MPSLRVVPGAITLTRILREPSSADRGKILDGLRCGTEDSVGQGMAAGEGADIDNSALLETELLDRLLNGQNRLKHVGREFAMEFRNGDTLERF